MCDGHGLEHNAQSIILERDKMAHILHGLLLVQDRKLSAPKHRLNPVLVSDWLAKWDLAHVPGGGVVRTALPANVNLGRPPIRGVPHATLYSGAGGEPRVMQNADLMYELEPECVRRGNNIYLQKGLHDTRLATALVPGDGDMRQVELI